MSYIHQATIAAILKNNLTKKKARSGRKARHSQGPPCRQCGHRSGPGPICDYCGHKARLACEPPAKASSSIWERLRELLS